MGAVSWALLLCCCSAAACARRERGAPASAPDSAVARAIAADRAERLVMPLAPAGAGRVTLQGVAEARADLPAPAAIELAPPAGEWLAPPADPAPVPEAPERTESEAHDGTIAQLKPPIPRGLPVVPEGGRGGQVTLDVRVDETGEVTDVERVEGDADSATVAAATSAAFATRYHPALLGQRRVAVWTRQAFVVRRGR